jgi:anti-sigma regulatory factor (Ser/Thr protein kinase)
MRNGTSVAVAVVDGSQVGEARRVAQGVAGAAGFDESARSDIGIVVTEAATNVVRHAGKGELLFRELPGPGPAGLEMVCVAHGPGMRDLPACLADGYSSRGTMGGGFGAMLRLAGEFSIWSAPDAGTALVCRFFPGADPARNGGPPAVAGLALPRPGETACGDGWAAVTESARYALFMVDGLGHGPGAEEAAATALKLFRERPWTTPAQMMDVLQAGMRSTRGAAVAIAVIDRPGRQIRFAGVGNLSAVLVTGDKTRGLVSHNGTIGYQMRKAQEFVYPWESGALLVMHSDGLASHWTLERYPGLFRQDPALVAAVLYRDHARGRDDVSVLVCRLSVEAAGA